MRFFKLTHPRYATDRERDRRNPVTSTVSHRIPGIACEVCGPWSSSRRLRVSLPARVDEFAKVTFLPIDEWTSARDRWASLVGVDPNHVEPGATLGPPSGTCTGPIVEAVLHAMPGEIWVAASVRDALITAGLAGVSFAAVRFPPERTSADLWEIVVHGRAWRKGSTEENLRLCKVCGRRGFPSPRNLAVDESRWDGSDFLCVDGNPNIIVVSERAAAVFTANGFTNVVLEPTH